MQFYLKFPNIHFGRYENFCLTEALYLSLHNEKSIRLAQYLLYFTMALTFRILKLYVFKSHALSRARAQLFLASFSSRCSRASVHQLPIQRLKS
jgi:hypothetical protein